MSNSIEVLKSKALIVSNINHDEFNSIDIFAKRIWWYKRRNQIFKDLYIKTNLHCIKCLMFPKK